jgi:alpha-mannosidase
MDYASGREAIAPGSVGNCLELFGDTPNEWDAWDIEEFYRRNVSGGTDTRSVTLERGGWDAVVVVERLVGSSPVTQRISLGAGSESLGISTVVDWRENEKLLKLGFALDIRADRSAAETQFGHVFRPTHTNTSWEAAKFEICAHRWIHVAEPGYGVAISNASTYGHDVVRGVRADGGTTTTVRLSLLRAPKFPDPNADRGLHELNVTIRPGASIADAVEEGYRTNLVPRVVHGAHPAEPLFAVFNAALVIEAVKLAEDGSGDVIVRVYESLGERSTGLLSANFPVASVEVTDLLERTVGAPAGVVVGRDSAQLTLRPFQLLTLRFRR